MEKQNKTVRQKRKKEDMARIRTLVGTDCFSYCLIIMKVTKELNCHLFVVCRQCLQL